MEINNTDGCALCNATWGEYWDDVDGERMQFCCSICAAAFKNMVKAVKDANGWPRLDKLYIVGNNSSGRKCAASFGEAHYRFYIKFYDDGRIFDFHELST